MKGESRPLRECLINPDYWLGPPRHTPVYDLFVTVGAWIGSITLTVIGLGMWIVLALALVALLRG